MPKKGKGRNRRRPAGSNYVSFDKRNKNKRRRAQRLANRFGHPVKIKIKKHIHDPNAEWEEIKPQAGKQ